jgi:hypothetical protein
MAPSSWGAAPVLRLIVGVVLIVCARPIARLLSFGPLIGRAEADGTA